jgi:hypothetical protein
VERPDGSEVEVHLDSRFEPVGSEPGDDGEDEREDDEDEDGAAAPRFSDPRRIDNAYLPLARFRRCELRGREDGARVRAVRTLLDRSERFTVAGRAVDAAVVEDRDYEDGELVERTLDYFAQADDGTVHYLGEDVDDYEGGKVIGHHGAWRYGRETKALGVAMPADPRVGATWRFEDVPGVTVESDRVVSSRGGVIRVREDIEPEGVVEHKLYRRGTGVIREEPPDGRLELVRCR